MDPIRSHPNPSDSEHVKIVPWHDFEHELVRLLSLSSALEQARQTKSTLQSNLHPLIQVQEESLSRLNKLDDMQRKLEARKLAMGKALIQSNCAASDAKEREQKLCDDIRTLLVAGTNLSVDSKKLQKGNKLPTAEEVHVRSLQKMLRKREQYMTSQVSFLYPVKASIGTGHELELESLSGSSKSGNFCASKPLNSGALSISGLQLTMLPFTKLSFFTDKKVIQRSATALGYVAHAVTLIAAYLEVPLRYALRLGGSHSYIKDHAPSVDPNSHDLSSNSLLSTNLKAIEFPLFLEGQDTTRAAYAIFLLNKDLEQLLNFVGEKSLGPRHVLGNLKELVRCILSPEYIDR